MPSNDSKTLLWTTVSLHIHHAMKKIIFSYLIILGTIFFGGKESLCPACAVCGECSSGCPFGLTTTVSYIRLFFHSVVNAQPTSCPQERFVGFKKENDD